MSEFVVLDDESGRRVNPLGESVEKNSGNTFVQKPADTRIQLTAEGVKDAMGNLIPQN